MFILLWFHSVLIIFFWILLSLVFLNTVTPYCILFLSPKARAWSFYLILFPQHKNTLVCLQYYLSCSSTFFKCFMTDIFSLKLIFDICIYYFWLCNILYDNMYLKFVLDHFLLLHYQAANLCELTQNTMRIILLKSQYLQVNFSRVNICK